MAAPIVCIYCKQKIDIAKEPFVQMSQSTFAHKSCVAKVQASKIEQQEQDYNELAKYIKELFGANYLSASVTKQIRDFRVEYGYTYKDMLNTLKYWYEVRRASKELAEGRIGIIPYVYEDAKKYYDTIERTNQLNKNVHYNLQMYHIEIDAPRPEEKKPKLFNLGDENNG